MFINMNANETNMFSGKSGAQKWVDPFEQVRRERNKKILDFITDLRNGYRELICGIDTKDLVKVNDSIETMKAAVLNLDRVGAKFDCKFPTREAVQSDLDSTTEKELAHIKRGMVELDRAVMVAQDAVTKDNNQSPRF